MCKNAIHTNDAPEAVGPYSQAVVVELGGGRRMIFTAGQIGLNPATMELVEGGIEAQAKRVIKNLTAILESAGAGWGDVVKTTVFLADMDDFATFNEIYGETVSAPPPARSVAGAKALPKGCLLEMELIAVCQE
jgi:2-iminobutanoate/2-iminopropanoate deaminase